MKAVELDIADVIVFEPRVFADERGYFYESFNQHAFERLTGLSPVFVQDNHSESSMGVLRGLHYQLAPRAQAKLIRVVRGEVFDVAVDIRPGSKTFGRWVGQILSAENRKQMWVPEGFAHGFLTLSETAEVLYKTTDIYAPELERCLLWDDPSIGIEWPLDRLDQSDQGVLVSEKDKCGRVLSSCDV